MFSPQNVQQAQRLNVEATNLDVWDKTDAEIIFSYTTSDFELDTSPAKNTRNRKYTVVSPTPMSESLIERRRIKAGVMDFKVWDKPDDELSISASKAWWNYTAYNHVKASLQHHLEAHSSRDYLESKFMCYTDPVNHKPHHQKYMQNVLGTKTVDRCIEECVQWHGILTQGPNAKGAQRTLHGLISKYTPEVHRALIVMRCAVDKEEQREYY